MNSKRVFLSTMRHNSTRPNCRWATINEGGWVDASATDEGTPIEDFGMMFFTDHEITQDQAFEVFLRLIDAHDKDPEKISDVPAIVKEIEKEFPAPASALPAAPKDKPPVIARRRPG